MNTDVFSTEKRSAVMRAVKGKDTKPELKVRKLLFAQGYRYRLHSDLPGKPDIVLAKHRAAIFVHGCFWHGHDCMRGSRKPKANAEYWSAKIARNVARDQRVLKELKTQDWRTLTLWECELKNEAALSRRLSRFLK